MTDITDICKRAKKASYALAGYGTERKNAMLEAIAEALSGEESLAEVYAGNEQDIDAAKKAGKDATFLDRLALNPSRVRGMVEGLRQIVALEDPVGKIVEERTLGNGLRLKKTRSPLGVVGIIYEARPNVTVDAAALCIKSGNTVVLRGSKDAINSNRALYRIMQRAIEGLGLDPDVVSFIDEISRDATKVMLGAEGLIDVIIPRGGEGLKKFVLENAAMPVIASAGGNCHVYVEKTADFEKALPIIVNAKIQRPSVCNAAEHLLVDRCIADEFFPLAYAALNEKQKVEVVGDDIAVRAVPQIAKMTEDDFKTEYLTLKMSFSTVDGVREAVDHINRYGTGHSEAIVSRDREAVEYFTQNVDSAAVYANASTRFTDGFVFGLGAEMGISTQKLHARGPIGLNELTSYRYVVIGDGQIRE